MTVKDAEERLEALQKQIYAYDYAMNSIAYDSQTVAPKGSAESRGEALAVLSGMYYEILANTETGNLLEFFREHQAELSPRRRREVELLTRDYEQIIKVPAAEYMAYTRLINDAESVWQRAKKDNDYPAFGSYIHKIASTLIKFAGYYSPNTLPYNVWLDQFERGLTMEQLDVFFQELQETIVPLVQRITNEAEQIDDGFLKQDFPVEKQRELAEYLMGVMTIDQKYCVLGESEHPFTTDFSRRDVRITTHYYPELMSSSLYSVIHEGGHALYELHTDEDLMYTCLAGGISMGIHESQSRLFENMIGRSHEFIEYIYPKLLELFPTQLSNVSSEQFYRAVNRCEPSLIRTEADELTYCLHIMVRYEAEKLMFEGKVSEEELPGLWAELMKKYLAIEVPDDARGVLQDTHWSGGAMGYFPSYAIGSAYAAQIMHFMEQDFFKSGISIKKLIRKGELLPIVQWLTEKFYKFGRMMDPAELLQNACGEPFNPTYYTKYLEKKFTKLYGLTE